VSRAVPRWQGAARALACRRFEGRRRIKVERDIALRTERLKLEALDVRHSEALWAAVEASLDELRPWLFWAATTSLAGTIAFAEISRRAWSAGSDYVFAILHHGEPVGTIGLHHYDDVLEAAELGYWMSSDMCGRGLMTEAAGAVVGFGFERLELHRMSLHAARANVGSQRVAEKVGFRREGLLRDGSRGAGGWHDCYLYGLLSTDAR
jgi:ribosomal-protein-serine acetyltransferase